MSKAALFAVPVLAGAVLLLLVAAKAAPMPASPRVVQRAG